MPWEGSARLVPDHPTDAIAARIVGRADRKKSIHILATMLLLACLFEAERRRAIQPFQTFSLAMGGRLRITNALLDRFLACMKPASITQRPPCAGVFFGQISFCPKVRISALMIASTAP
jgi:hypothetical protein